MAYIQVLPPSALDKMVFEELPDGSIVQHNDVFLLTDPRFYNKQDTSTQLAVQKSLQYSPSDIPTVGDKDMLLTTTPSRYAQSFTELENYQKALTGYAQKLKERAKDTYRMHSAINNDFVTESKQNKVESKTD